MANTTRVTFQIGDIVELRKNDGPTREFKGSGERRIVVDVQDTYAVLVTIGNISKVTSLISSVDVMIDEGSYYGYIVGTINMFLISRNLNDLV